eukprot:3882062-Rhodomonas_salina.3
MASLVNTDGSWISTGFSCSPTSSRSLRRAAASPSGLANLRVVTLQPSAERKISRTGSGGVSFRNPRSTADLTVDVRASSDAKNARATLAESAAVATSRAGSSTND